MNTVIVGLGALGGVYATALKGGGFPLRIALDSERLERYSHTPFLFNGTEHTFDYFTPKKGDEAADLMIITTKWPGYRDALELIRPIIAEHTIILPLLNGITSEKLAGEIFGMEKVLYGYFIGHTASREGRTVDQDGRYNTVFGNLSNDLPNLSPKVQAVKDLFDSAGIKYRIDEDMLASLWQKYIINIGLNQITALLRKPYGAIKSDPEALILTRALMDEAAAIANRVGVKGANEMVDAGLQTLDKMRAQDSSSMLQDVEAGRQTEVEIFAGEICRLGELYGIPTPNNEKVYDALS